MRFTWDARKSDRNLRERGFDYEFATQIFDDPTLERADTRHDYDRPGQSSGHPDHRGLHRPGRSRRRSQPTNHLGPKEQTVVNAKRTKKPPAQRSGIRRGRADFARLRRVSKQEIQATSPPELADLPEAFWDEATIVEPAQKQPISLRVDVDVLDWFKMQGPRYQSRMNAVLRSYMTQRRHSSRRRAG